MSKPNTSHLRIQPEPQPAAKQSDAATQSLLYLVQAFKDVTNHDSFRDAEADINLLKARDQASMQRNAELERESKEVKASEEAKLSELDAQYNLTKRDILKTYREEVTAAENKYKETEQKLYAARSVIEQKTKEVSAAQRGFAQARKESGEKDQNLRVHKEKVAQLGSTVGNYGTELATLKRSVKTLQGDLQQTTESLNTIKDFGLPLEEYGVDEAFSQFNHLWRRCIGSVSLCFATDLHQSVLRDESAWDNLKKSDFVNHRVPLPQTNSVLAKALRCVVVLAYISQLLTTEIFRVLHLVDGDKALREELGCLAQENPRKESFLRSLLISLDDKKGRRAHIRWATQQIYKQVRDLLEFSVAETFRADLEAIFEHAAHIWRRLQASNRHYVAELDVTDDETLTWRAIQLSSTELRIDERDITGSAISTDDVELKVFPRLYIIGQKEDMSVFPGKVLQQSQTTATRPGILQAQGNAQLARNPNQLQRRRTSLYENDGR